MKKYSYITKEYKKSHFYWEFINIYMKLFVMLFLSLCKNEIVYKVKIVIFKLTNTYFFLTDLVHFIYNGCIWSSYF